MGISVSADPPPPQRCSLAPSIFVYCSFHRVANIMKNGCITYLEISIRSDVLAVSIFSAGLLECLLVSDVTNKDTPGQPWPNISAITSILLLSCCNCCL